MILNWTIGSWARTARTQGKDASAVDGKDGRESNGDNNESGKNGNDDGRALRDGLEPIPMRQDLLSPRILLQEP